MAKEAQTSIKDQPAKHAVHRARECYLQVESRESSVFPLNCCNPRLYRSPTSLAPLHRAIIMLAQNAHLGKEGGVPDPSLAIRRKLCHSPQKVMRRPERLQWRAFQDQGVKLLDCCCPDDRFLPCDGFTCADTVVLFATESTNNESPAKRRIGMQSSFNCFFEVINRLVNVR